MTPQEQLRALVDKANKQQKYPTGGDRRTLAEVINTSAIAKGQAIDRTKKAIASKTLPLRELQLQLKR